MLVLVTGSAGHLGEALMRRLPELGHTTRGFDRVPGPYVDVVGDLRDAGSVAGAMEGVQGVIHAATLHKPHIARRAARDFVETNVVGTQTVLDAAARAGVRSLVFTSSTSAFGRALDGRAETGATWVDEDLRSRPKNIYGVTKVAAEDLAELAHLERGLPVVVLRAARFFPEIDDRPDRARHFDDGNLKVLEFLHRRVDLEDLVDAHEAALVRAPSLGFAKYVVSATTPLRPEDRDALMRDPASVIARRCAPGTAEAFERLGWRYPSVIDRVYDNARAVRELDWTPRFTFAEVLERAARGDRPASDLACAVGQKGYG